MSLASLLAFSAEPRVSPVSVGIVSGVEVGSAAVGDGSFGGAEVSSASVGVGMDTVSSASGEVIGFEAEAGVGPASVRGLSAETYGNIVSANIFSGEVAAFGGEAASFLVGGDVASEDEAFFLFVVFFLGADFAFLRKKVFIGMSFMLTQLTCLLSVAFRIMAETFGPVLNFFVWLVPLALSSERHFMNTDSQSQSSSETIAASIFFWSPESWSLEPSNPRKYWWMICTSTL